jgi:putative membrane protein
MLMMWGNGWGWGWGWVWGGLMMLVFWGALIALVVFLVRGGGIRPPHDPQARDRPTADEILAERFARGEISEEEFEQRRQVLDRRT